MPKAYLCNVCETYGIGEQRGKKALDRDYASELLKKLAKYPVKEHEPILKSGGSSYRRWTVKIIEGSLELFIIQYYMERNITGIDVVFHYNKKDDEKRLSAVRKLFTDIKLPKRFE